MLRGCIRIPCRTLQHRDRDVQPLECILGAYCMFTCASVSPKKPTRHTMALIPTVCRPVWIVQIVFVRAFNVPFCLFLRILTITLISQEGYRIDRIAHRTVCTDGQCDLSRESWPENAGNKYDGQHTVTAIPIERIPIAPYDAQPYLALSDGHNCHTPTTSPINPRLLPCFPVTGPRRLHLIAPQVG